MIPRQHFGDIGHNSTSSPPKISCNAKTIFSLVLVYLFIVLDIYIAYDWIGYLETRSLKIELDPYRILEIVDHYTLTFLGFAFINFFASFFILDFFYKLEDGPHIATVAYSFWFYILLSFLLFGYYVIQSFFFFVDGSLCCMLPILIGILLFLISLVKAIFF